ncbi:MAG: ATP-binding cassette domain-containing protein [Eubacteriales bacterium]
MAHIKITGLKYRYPDATRLALDNFNLEIKQGEFIGVVGANGAGKSTFCQALLGIVPNFYKGAYGGEVLIDGVCVRDMQVDDLCQKVGLVFQNPFNQ